MRARCFLALGLAAGFAALILAAVDAPPARAQEGCDRFVVSPGGADAGSCSGQNSPCRTVQYALSQADPGERICVADCASSGCDGPSIYTGTLIITRSVTLDGAWSAGKGVLGWLFLSNDCAPQDVVLDAQGTGRVIHISGSITPAIHCFTITGGDAAGLGGDPGGGIDPGGDAGGGICSLGAAPLILHNVISGNYGCQGCSGNSHGGGLYLLDAPATTVISGNLIANNVADDTFAGMGGGIMLRDSSAQIRHNTIQDNRAGCSVSIGGAIAVEGGAPLIADNDILTNVSSLSGSGAGGGISIRETTAVTVERNLIQGNIAYGGTTTFQLSRGGGVYYARGSGTIVFRDNVIRGNLAASEGPGQGGGMYARYLASGDVVSGNTWHNNVASENLDGYGGGFYLDTCRATIERNAIFGNIGSLSATGYGGGLYVYEGAGLIQSNAITENHAVINGSGFGGGVAIITSTLILQDNRIADNRGALGGQAMGGGIFVLDGAPQFVRNHVVNNAAGGTSVITGSGGGFSLWATRPCLEGNVILDNVASGGAEGRGGGVRLLSCPAFTLTNNIIAHNDASALGSGVAVLDSSGWIVHNTIAANEGDGIGVGIGADCQVGLVNTIVASQTVGIRNTGGSTVLAQYTLFDANGLNYAGSVTSTNEIPGPAGLMPANYHLHSGSGAIDRAFPLAAVTTDVDGDPRPLGLAPDVGADEARFVYLPLVLRNP